MNSHNLLLQQLDTQEQKEFEILAHHLIPIGWQSQLSYGEFALLLHRYIASKIDHNYAEIKLKKIQKIGLVEITKNSTSTNGERCQRLANTIILKSLAYKGALLIGEVLLDSILYIRRKADEVCQQELTLAREVNKSVPFMRVKGAKGMGKSSLLDRIGDFLESEKKEKVARVDFGTDAFGSDTFTDRSKLFDRFTEEVGKAFVKLTPGLVSTDLKFAFDKYKPPGKNCTDYLE